MAQPVKLSDEIVLDARLTGELSQRSIAGQVEYWARLGRAIEALLRTEEVLELKRRGDAKPLSTSLGEVETLGGQKRLAAVLAARAYPHFEAAPDHPGLLIKVDEDGTRTLGRFVQRVFTPTDPR